MDFTDSQIPPPEGSRALEQLCLALFQQIWRDPYARRVGRGGQRQKGVDIVSSGPPWRGVQCKKRSGSSRRSSGLLKEIDGIIKLAEAFEPPLAQLIITTTLEKDARSEAKIAALSAARAAAGKFDVVLLSWASGIVKFDLSAREVAITERYIQPSNRFISFNEHTILIEIGVSDCGTWIVGSGNQLLFIWRRAIAKPREIMLRASLVLIKFLRESEIFVTLDKTGSCQLWSASSGAVVQHVAKEVHDVAVSNDGKYLGLTLSDGYRVRTLKVPVFVTREALVAEIEAMDHALAH